MGEPLTTIPMPCPNCGRTHNHGPHIERKGASFVGEPNRYDPDLTYHCPADVECDGCGALLRYTVPLIAVGSGWNWRIALPATRNARTP